MTTVTRIFVFILAWWVFIYAVLPFGVKPVENDVAGQDKGAPLKPMLLKKFLITTFLAGLFVVGLEWFLSLDLFNLNENFVSSVTKN